MLRLVDRLDTFPFVVLRPVDVEVDRLATLLFVVSRPVDRLVIPVDVEVDRLVRLLFVVLTPVDRELTPVDKLASRLIAVLSPVDVEVDNELTPVDRLVIPVDVEVDRLVRLLFVVLTPVDRELTPVDKLASRLIAVLSPVDVEVDNELTPVDKLPTAVEVDVDNEFTAELVANSWLPLTASVEAAEIWPAATLVSCRCSVADPMLTTPTGAPPAKLYAVPPIVPVFVATAAAVVVPSPSATLRDVVATARFPSATAFDVAVPVTAAVPMATPPAVKSVLEA